MKDYKYKQYTFNLFGSFSDTLHSDSIKIESSNEETIHNAVEYLSQEMPTLTFPSKSYAVALIYSYLIEQLFAEDFWTPLNDQQLFCGNDKYFKTYQDSPEIYDAILLKIGGKDLLLKHAQLSQIKQTLFYFSEEFDIDLEQIYTITKKT